MDNQDNENKKKGGNPAFYKGMKPLNPKGRPKGIPNHQTREIKELISDFLQQKALPELFEKFDKMSYKVQTDFVTNIMKYVVPTLASQKNDMNISGDGKLKIEVIYDNSIPIEEVNDDDADDDLDFEDL